MTDTAISPSGIGKGDTVRYNFFFQHPRTREMDESKNRWVVLECGKDGKVKIQQLIPPGRRNKEATLGQIIDTDEENLMPA
jgi:hypothetical protein